MEDTVKDFDLPGLAKHQDSWEEAKKRRGVTDASALSSEDFHKLIALAEQIRKGE